eukprot:TRINITY_DN11499_c0_g1_i2.p1 TRINITY_DN11499_c0_g1~~TRINITY_DN11499_c0_g1_i2.p1  ORF type:complete len:267 (+),score=86.22 TRINITY_DN11499_c0_g1_i2:80-802(+)
MGAASSAPPKDAAAPAAGGGGAGEGKLRVLCCNLACHWFSPNDPPERWARLEAVAREVAALSPDVFVVQELYTFAPVWGRELAWFSGLMAEQGFAVAASPWRWVGMSQGLVVYSKLPIEGNEARPFATQQVDVPGGPRKGVQICTLNWGGMPVHIVNAHLAWKGSVGPQHLSWFRAACAEVAAREGAAVACGDLNNSLPALEGYRSLTPAEPTHDDGATYDHAFVHAAPSARDTSTSRRG